MPPKAVAEKSLSDKLYELFKRSDFIQGAPPKVFEGIVKAENLTSVELRQELECLVDKLCQFHLNGFVSTMSVLGVSSSLRSVDLPVFFKKTLKAMVENLSAKLECLWPIFPEDMLNNVEPKTSLYNLAFILLLENIYNQSKPEGVAERFQKALAVPELAAAMQAGQAPLGFFSSTIAWFRRSTIGDAPAVPVQLSQDMSQYFVMRLAHEFLSLGRVSVINGVYCWLSVFCVVQHEPYLLNVLSNDVFLDRPEEVGYTLLFLLIGAFESQADQRAFEAEEELKQQLDKFLAAQDVAGWGENPSLKNKYLTSVFEGKTILAFAYEKKLYHVAVYLAGQNLQLALEHLFLVCKTDHRQPSLKEVAALLDRGLDPRAASPANGVSLLHYYRQLASDQKLLAKEKHVYALVLMIDVLYRALEAESIEVRGELFVGLKAKHHYVNKQLTEDVVQKLGRVAAGQSSMDGGQEPEMLEKGRKILDQIFQQLIAEEELLPSLLGINSLAKEGLQQRFIGLLFATEPFLSKLTAQKRLEREERALTQADQIIFDKASRRICAAHTVMSPPLFQMLAIAAQIFAGMIDRSEYATGCEQAGQRKLFQMVQDQQGKNFTSVGRQDIQKLSRRDQVWYDYLNKHFFAAQGRGLPFVAQGIGKAVGRMEAEPEPQPSEAAVEPKKSKGRHVRFGFRGRVKKKAQVLDKAPAIDEVVVVNSQPTSFQRSLSLRSNTSRAARDSCVSAFEIQLGEGSMGDVQGQSPMEHSSPSVSPGFYVP